MSSEEVLELCRVLAALNYDGQQTIVSPESFSKPNFNLVCDILAWMAAIVQDDQDYYRPLADGGSSTRMTEQPETERINYLVQMGKLFRRKLAVELNLVNLYRADNLSCRELGKVANFIYRAAKLAVQTSPQATSSILEKSRLERAATIEQLTSLLREADQGGTGQLDNLASLSEVLLQDELAKFNDDRLKVMDRSLELREIEKLLQGGQAGVIERTKELARTNQVLEEDLRRLDKRLELKELELETSKGKLDNLLIQSPVYLDQYERLRANYEQQYKAYVSKFRNLSYLKACVYGQKPVGSTRDGISSFELAAGSLLAGTGGARPPKLAESLLDVTSNPMSASLTVTELVGAPVGAIPEELGAGLAGGLAGGLVRTGGGGATEEAAGRRGAAENAGRPATAGDTTGLELEGLLNEFVADSAGSKGKEEELEDEEAAGESTFVDEDDDEDVTEDEDDSLVGGF